MRKNQNNSHKGRKAVTFKGGLDRLHIAGFASLPAIPRRVTGYFGVRDQIHWCWILFAAWNYPIHASMKRGQRWNRNQSSLAFAGRVSLIGRSIASSPQALKIALSKPRGYELKRSVSRSFAKTSKSSFPRFLMSIDGGAPMYLLIFFAQISSIEFRVR